MVSLLLMHLRVLVTTHNRIALIYLLRADWLAALGCHCHLLGLGDLNADVWLNVKIIRAHHADWLL